MSALAPSVLNIAGVGPVSAAVFLTAYSHVGRVRSKAAFTSLAGAAPFPASSGNTNRHRLNRHGDRLLNSALETVARVRLSYDPDTRSYKQRRLAEGKTTRETRRMLKRYIARQIYRHLDGVRSLSRRVGKFDSRFRHFDDRIVRHLWVVVLSQLSPEKLHVRSRGLLRLLGSERIEPVALHCVNRAGNRDRGRVLVEDEDRCAYRHGLVPPDSRHLRTTHHRVVVLSMEVDRVPSCVHHSSTLA